MLSSINTFVYKSRSAGSCSPKEPLNFDDRPFVFSNFEPDDDIFVVVSIDGVCTRLTLMADIDCF